jgi:hypothetical protein
VSNLQISCILYSRRYIKESLSLEKLQLHLKTGSSDLSEDALLSLCLLYNSKSSRTAMSVIRSSNILPVLLPWVEIRDEALDIVQVACS